MTLDLADLMQISPSKNESPFSAIFSWLDMFKSNVNNEDIEDSRPSMNNRHEYVQLKFPAEVLIAMKEVGMACCVANEDGSKNPKQKNPFVSTNDGRVRRLFPG